MSTTTSTTTTPAPLPLPDTSYLTYLNYYEVIVCLVCQCIALVVFAHLLYCSLFNKKKLLMGKDHPTSTTMLLFMGTHLINSALTLPYSVYLVWNWHAPNGQYLYSPSLLFWLGFPYEGYLSSAPVAACFLTIDRVLMLSLKLNYRASHRRTLEVVDALMIVGFYLFGALFNLLELPLDAQDIKCENIACVLTKYRALPLLIIKDVFGSINLLFTVAFFFLVRSKNNSSGAEIGSHIKNRTLKATIIGELAFNITPGYISALFIVATDTYSAQYVGQITTLFCSMDAACIGVFYSLVMLKRFRGWTSTKGTTSSVMMKGNDSTHPIAIVKPAVHPYGNGNANGYMSPGD